MRLSTEEKQIIKSAVKEVMGESAIVLLFGSRVDESKRGGDIDLFIDANLPNALDRVQKKSRLWAKLQQRLGEQRIDIIIAANKPEERQEIEHVARETGIRII
ncbi:MAG TPA: DNA polymerase III subunit beta [Gammaproteobacteria bacterium]|nr:DNA polymerase III subunit beta [Gammaproteobacteria bacterium]